MRVVYMGTPALSASILRAIVAEHEVVGVYTRPDAVRGRGKKLVPSDVKVAALEEGIPVFTPASLRDARAQEELRELRPDVICVAAYGALLPAEVLQIPPFGCLNVHTSLLPRWRGAAPMQRAILACDESSGVCIMRMEEGLDTGPYCRRIEVVLGDMYLDELQGTLAEAGGSALVGALAGLETETLVWTPQASEGVTYAAKIGKGELDLDPSDTARTSCAKVRASDAAHPAHARIAGRSVTVERARVAEDDQAIDLCTGLASGEAVFRNKRLLAMTEDGIVEIQAVKPEGKKSMEARAFAAGIQGIKNATVPWGRT